jgi:hypothetical protein
MLDEGRSHRLGVVAFNIGLVLLLTASCSFNGRRVGPVQQAVGDAGLGTIESCAPPCFWNITPGKTSMDDAITQLRDHGIYEDCEIVTTRDGQFHFISCQNAISIGFRSQDLTVYSISLFPASPVPFSQASSKIGYPDCVFVTPPLLPDHPATYAQVYFDSPRILMHFEPENATAFTISPDTPVTYVMYGGELAPERQASCQVWNGYDVYYPLAGE